MKIGLAILLLFVRDCEQRFYQSLPALQNLNDMAAKPTGRLKIFQTACFMRIRYVKLCKTL